MRAEWRGRQARPDKERKTPPAPAKAGVRSQARWPSNRRSNRKLSIPDPGLSEDSLARGENNSRDSSGETKRLESWDRLELQASASARARLIHEEPHTARGDTPTPTEPHTAVHRRERETTQPHGAADGCKIMLLSRPLLRQIVRVHLLKERRTRWNNSQ